MARYGDMLDIIQLDKIKDLNKGADLITKNKKTVVIVGDADTDGVSATSILTLQLKKLDYKVHWISNDRKFSNGVNEEMVRRIISYEKEHGNVGIVVTVDHGSVNNNSYKIIKENIKGVKIIVTDHHQVDTNFEKEDGEMPYADAFINQQRPSVSYGKDLNGCAMAYLLGVRTGMLLGHEDKWFLEYTPLLAITVISDVMDVTKDYNKAMYYVGVKVMSSFYNNNINMLLKNANIHVPITSGFIGKAISPQLNSPGRVGNSAVAVKMLVEEHDHAGMGLVIDKYNRDRKELLIKARKQVDTSIKAYRGKYKHGVIGLLMEEEYEGVNGILSGAYAEHYKAPCIILTLGPDKTVGSCRGYDADMLGILRDIQENTDGIIIKAGGHKIACGVTIHSHRLEDFMSEFAMRVKALKKEQDKLGIVKAFNADDVTLKDYMEQAKHEPYGKGNPYPTYTFTGKLTKKQTLGRSGHALIRVNRLGGFFMNGANTLNRFEKGDIIEVTGGLSLDSFKGELSIDVKSIKRIS